MTTTAIEDEIIATSNDKGTALQKPFILVFAENSSEGADRINDLVKKVWSDESVASHAFPTLSNFTDHLREEIDNPFFRGTFIDTDEIIQGKMVFPDELVRPLTELVSVLKQVPEEKRHVIVKPMKENLHPIERQKRQLMVYHLQKFFNN